MAVVGIGSKGLHKEMERQVREQNLKENACAHCGGPIALRNPTGECDHLYWPDMLTDEARRANGFREVAVKKWVK